MTNPRPDVSGFTRNEKFIMESLTSLQASATELRDRTARLEAQVKVLEESYRARQSSASTSQALQHKLLEGRTQIWLAVVGGAFTLLSSVTALIVSIFAK